MSATSAQFFNYLWFMPSLGVRSPWLRTSVVPAHNCMTEGQKLHPFNIAKLCCHLANLYIVWCNKNWTKGSNVWCRLIRTKHSSDTLLRLVRISLHQTLVKHYYVWFDFYCIRHYVWKAARLRFRLGLNLTLFAGSVVQTAENLLLHTARFL